MTQLIKMELKRAFTGTWMKITLGMGLFLALSHFIFRVLPVDLLSGYNQYVASSTPQNLLSGWMAGSASIENEIYKYIVYLLAVLPYGASYYEDCKNGLVKNIYTRDSKTKFLASKSIAVFLSGGVAAVFPLITNLMLSATVLPVIFPEWNTGPNCDGLFVHFYYHNYILYFSLMFLMVFIYAGLVAGLALSISLYARNIFIVLTSPFIVCILFNKICAYINNRFVWGFQLSRVFDVVQLGGKYPEGMLAMTLLLLLSGYILFMMKGVRDDTY